MGVKIYIQPPRDDIYSNIELIKLLKRELELIYNLFLKRLNELKKEDVFENEDIPKPNFYFRSFEHDFSDVTLSVLFKSYLFIIRQTIEKIFRVIYQSRKILGYDKVQNPIPDLSKSGHFGRNFEKLLKDQYNYDYDILNLLKKWSDLIIVTRIIRNALKTQALFKVWIINIENKREVKIICPLLPRERKDPTLKLIKQPMSASIEEIKNFILEPSIMGTGIEMIKEFYNLFVKKIPKKQNGSDDN
ncbi:hypothetical protein Calab_1032 [Caldithrix abyssi DSM 13497]|uniref:Uncharacterized protein n=1 Tax=Caldithrix abyssi DSM 13497 TaxID=880073 RepID=H1XVT9_CALAY|nr:hypothetical protein [Caldithrix abyssi]APF20867.1 hypothetical protein Cabys_4122 [Caldithrix abyssi DSM 13497]EHO40666.1 hypothetical protein Calab_1032 [Caldithrix abyssi DSM 13497]